MPDTASRTLSDAHTQSPRLKGRKAIVTGGTTGIGRAISVVLASEGVENFTCGRDAPHLADGLKRINEVGKGNGLALDLADRGNIDKFFVAAEEALGRYDIPVINAATPIDDVTNSSQNDVNYALAIDYGAYVLSAQKAAAALGKTGDLILVFSMSAHHLGGEGLIYAGMKKGIQGFAEALHKELGNKGIKVGLIEPGLTGADFQYPDIPQTSRVR